MQLRNDYKNKLALRPELAVNKIVFPPIHIQEDDDILRYGMCWLYNGFAILTPEHGIFVDPGIDFSYRWLKAKYPVTRCDSIIVTHQHIDHGGGVTALLEWLLRARKMVNLLLTQETIDEGNIPKYYL